jgi:hypothetical protein
MYLYTINAVMISTGPSATKVWNAIMLENCFTDNVYYRYGQRYSSSSGSNGSGGIDDEVCLEKRVFHR